MLRNKFFLRQSAVAQLKWVSGRANQTLLNPAVVGTSPANRTIPAKSDGSQWSATPNAPYRYRQLIQKGCVAYEVIEHSLHSPSPLPQRATALLFLPSPNLPDAIGKRRFSVICFSWGGAQACQKIALANWAKRSNIVALFYLEVWQDAGDIGYAKSAGRFEREASKSQLLEISQDNLGSARHYQFG